MLAARTTRAAIALTIAWLMAYGATVFGGFVRDDFGWVYHSRLTSWASIPEIFSGSHLFYRPLVQFSFGITEWIFGVNAMPYALTNLLLGLACAAAIFALARALGMAAWAALLAAALWAFNFHGINMAIIWLSGRTSLLATLFSTLAALALVRHRAAAAGILGFAAFLSKEEVVALPLILTIWLIIDGSSIKRSLGLWIALAVYFPLRNQSGAIGISDAPPYYQFIFDPAHVLRNIVEYADRSSTLAVLVVMAAAIGFARLPKLEDEDRRLIVKGLVWLAGGFAATIWLPVRSSLYAVFPSVGAVLVAAVVVSAIARVSHQARATRLAVAACALPFLLLPIYWQRNVRWTELRSLSAQTIRAIQSDRPEGPALVVLLDDLTTRANFRHVFAGLLPEASAIHFGGQVSLWIEPPPPEIDPAARPASTGRTVTFRLVDGRVEPIRIVDVGN
jgi:hypothetical protein